MKKNSYPERDPRGLDALSSRVELGRRLYAQGYIIADGKRWEIEAVSSEFIYLKVAQNPQAERTIASIPISAKFLRGTN